MLRSHWLTAACLLLLSPFAFADLAAWQSEHLPFGPPVVADCDDCTSVVREGYALLYDPEHQVPLWVAYRLDRQDTTGPSRSGSFREDEAVSGERAENDDYYRTGFDKGHMSPAEDSRKNATTMKESFFLTNAVPQTTKLNRGYWSRLEGQVRSWMHNREQLWVISGPVFGPGTKAIGDGVAVPSHCYKIVVDEKMTGGFTAIAFLLPNSDDVPHWNQTMLSVDAVELMTGIDFFPDLPDVQEERLESRCVISDWRTTASEPAPALSSPAPAFPSQPQYQQAYQPPRQSSTSGVTVYVTKSGMKYHRGDCRYLRKSKTAISLRAAAGRYEPCSVCRP